MRVNIRLSSIRRGPRPGGTFDSSPVRKCRESKDKFDRVPLRDDRSPPVPVSSRWRSRDERFYRPWRDGGPILHHFPALRTGLVSSGPSGTTSPDTHPFPLYPDAHRFPYIGPHVRTRGARSLTKSQTGIRRIPLTPGFCILNSSS